MPVDMKSVIAESLMKLIQRNGLDKVTVKALIEECHISRPTFYYHFQDMMDVLEYIIWQVTRQLEEESLRAETPREALKVFVAFSVERFPMLRRLLDSQRRTQVEQLMLEAVMGYLSTLIPGGCPGSSHKHGRPGGAFALQCLGAGGRAAGICRQARFGSGQAGLSAGADCLWGDCWLAGKLKLFFGRRAFCPLFLLPPALQNRKSVSLFDSFALL